MNSLRALFAIPAVPAVAVAAMVATSAPATAQIVDQFDSFYSLTDGLCVAQVSSAVTSNAYPEHAAFSVATTMVGVGDCTLPLTLNWRNVETGETGAFTVTAHGPGYWGNSGYSALFHPGIGHFTGTMTVGAAHTPEPGSVDFTVDHYQG
ncbi:hypothetical protein OG203_39485 [Nocardia sp. NBC_01499]|uniref:hypothetical protein n=1 Tax=Nocardia sp. NBC_01499 TaxID=2903597 RepID=UPI00387094D2